MSHSPETNKGEVLAAREIGELLGLTQQLLDCIANKDYSTYTKLCSENLTCFEPEARGNIVSGLAFHKYYFDMEKDKTPVQTTMANPNVMLLGDKGAVVSYVRLIQRLENGVPKTVASEETRVWKKESRGWKHVHFHRSSL